MEHLGDRVGDWNVKIDDQTEGSGMIALQGPKVMELISKVSSEVPTLKRYGFCLKNLLIVKLVISRTGYTGEDGVEVILGGSSAATAMKLMLHHVMEGDHITPAGLGARDTLRMEAGMPLYGHELDETIDPLSTGLNFAVSLDKDEPFVGQAALQAIAAQGPVRKLVGLRIDGKRTARQGMTVTKGDKEIGTVTSGCVSPTLGYPIAMAYVESNAASEGDTVQVALGAKRVDALAVKLPFYRR